MTFLNLFNNNRKKQNKCKTFNQKQLKKSLRKESILMSDLKKNLLLIGFFG